MSDVTQTADWPVDTVVEQPALVQSIKVPLSIYEGSARVRNSRSKRALDIVGAGSGLLFLAPLLLLIALITMAENRGSVLFRQRRTGLNGRPFLIYKFRTMRVMEDGALVTPATRQDLRVTRVGRILRRSSFDELPQLLNVLKGEMSLVGPRPHAVAHDEYYGQTVPSYILRFQVTPGITGLAQVSGYRGEVRDIQHMEARVAKDLEYIQGWSLARDVRILARTAVCGAFHRMAY